MIEEIGRDRCATWHALSPATWMQYKQCKQHKKHKRNKQYTPLKTSPLPFTQTCRAPLRPCSWRCSCFRSNITAAYPFVVLSALGADFPRSPAPLFAALFAPLTWSYGRPDLFDSYSAGILLVQMAVPQLRATRAARSLNYELSQVDFDLQR